MLIQSVYYCDILFFRRFWTTNQNKSYLRILNEILEWITQCNECIIKCKSSNNTEK